MLFEFVINSVYKRRNQCFSHCCDRSYSIAYTIQSNSQLAVQNTMKCTGEIIFIDKVEFIDDAEAGSLPYFILYTKIRQLSTLFRPLEFSIKFDTV